MTKDKNKEKAKKKALLIKTFLILFIVVCIAVTYFFKDQIEKAINFAYNPVISSDVSNSSMKVHFIDVGQADSIAIEFSSGKNILIDSGTRSSTPKLIDYLDKNIFKDSQEKEFDYFIMTHPHEDHIGGAPEIFRNYQINNCIRPQVYTELEVFEQSETISPKNVCNTVIYQNTIKALKEEPDCNILFSYQGLEINDNNAKFSIEFLSPNGINSYDNLNNYSPIMILTYYNKKFMFTGDAEKEVENSVLEINKNNLDILDVDVLKVGHHGSNTSTSKKFYEAVKPEMAVISCGANNKYGHPTASTLETLSNIKNSVFRTDLNGNIVFGVTTGGTISVATDYTYQMPFYFSWYYIAGVGIFVSIVVICIPAKAQKKIEKAIKKVSK